MLVPNILELYLTNKLRSLTNPVDKS